MKFKLDENFGSRTQHLFRTAGHEVQTIRDQGLLGCSDRRLYEICCFEKLCLVTLDLDFSDVTRFPPAEANGIVVIRVPWNPSLALFRRTGSSVSTNTYTNACGEETMGCQDWSNSDPSV